MESAEVELDQGSRKGKYTIEFADGKSTLKPAAKFPVDDAKTMVKYILSVKKS